MKFFLSLFLLCTLQLFGYTGTMAAAPAGKIAVSAGKQSAISSIAPEEHGGEIVHLISLCSRPFVRCTSYNHPLFLSRETCLQFPLNVGSININYFRHLLPAPLAHHLIFPHHFFW